MGTVLVASSTTARHTNAKGREAIWLPQPAHSLLFGFPNSFFFLCSAALSTPIPLHCRVFRTYTMNIIAYIRIAHLAGHLNRYFGGDRLYRHLSGANGDTVVDSMVPVERNGYE